MFMRLSEIQEADYQKQLEQLEEQAMDSPMKWEKSVVGNQAHYDFTDSYGRSVRVTMHGRFISRPSENGIVKAGGVNWTTEALGKLIGRIELQWPGKMLVTKYIPKPQKGAPAGVGLKTLATVRAACEDYMNSEGAEGFMFLWPPSRMRNLLAFIGMKPGQDVKLKNLFVAAAKNVAKSRDNYVIVDVKYPEAGGPMVAQDGQTFVVPRAWVAKDQDSGVSVLG